MTSYNHAQYIAVAIDSVLAQTMRDWELVVVEDGSADGSREIVERYASFDPRIRMLEHENSSNRGIAASLVLGIGACGADYVAFLESDDFWEPDFLEEMIAAVGVDGAGMAACDVSLVGDKSRFGVYDVYFELRNRKFSNLKFPADIFKTLLFENFVPTFSCAVARRSLLQKCRFDYPYQPWLDRSVWMQICRMAQFAYVPRKLTGWRIHSSSVIANEGRGYRSGWFMKLFRLAALSSDSKAMVSFRFVELLCFQFARCLAGKTLVAGRKFRRTTQDSWYRN
ncbi:MAG: glycosyltransferase [Victivallaceae bacterium]|nr:glycosyltransferase [Victivallaceae bacterium]